MPQEKKNELYSVVGVRVCAAQSSKVSALFIQSLNSYASTQNNIPFY